MDVLLVEDDRELRELVAELLWEDGHRVVQAHHGADALARLEWFHPDVVLLDLRMPVLSGWEFIDCALEKYRALPPMVLVSTDRAVASWAKELGAVDWICKPFTLESLRHILVKLRRAPPSSLAVH